MTLGAWIAVCALVAVILAYGVGGGRRFKRMMTPEHLAEIPRLLRKLKLEAWEARGKPPESKALPNSIKGHGMSREGLAVFYTIRPTEESFEHHLSLSWHGGALPGAFGRFFMILTHGALDLGNTPCQVGVTPGGRFHLSFNLPAAENASYVQRPVRFFGVEEALAVRERCWAAAEKLEVVRIDIPKM